MRQLLRNILLLCVLNAIWGQPRIRNGQNAKLGQFPYQAMLLLGNNWHRCGGSIIHKRWVLTAAHCVKDPSDVKKYNIAVGGVKRNAIDGTKYPIEALVIHEKYSESPFGQYDIALVRLKNDIQFNENVSPIKLPANNSNQYENDLAVLSGWGLTQDRSVGVFLPKFLQFVFLRIVEKRKCVESYRYLVRDSHICTSIDGGKSACSGDSGGPLVVGDTQVGIVVFGDGSCARYRPVVHSRVSYYVSWIKQQMEVYKDALPY